MGIDIVEYARRRHRDPQVLQAHRMRGFTGLIAQDRVEDPTTFNAAGKRTNRVEGYRQRQRARKWNARGGRLETDEPA